MDKELKEKLSKLLDMMLDKGLDVPNYIGDAFKEPCKISIEKKADGTAKTMINGNYLTVLLTLAGLEKVILEKAKVPTPVWENIKEIVGVKEAE